MIREVMPLSSRSISNRILLLDTKAISVPEKKAENISTMSMFIYKKYESSGVFIFIF
jgi:hypothetical protein